jgi:hypothetical protein
VLFMLVLLGIGLLLMPGADAFDRPACLSGKISEPVQNGNWMQHRSLQGCLE